MRKPTFFHRSVIVRVKRGPEAVESIQLGLALELIQVRFEIQRKQEGRVFSSFAGMYSNLSPI